MVGWLGKKAAETYLEHFKLEHFYCVHCKVTSIWEKLLKKSNYELEM